MTDLLICLHLFRRIDKKAAVQPGRARRQRKCQVTSKRVIVPQRSRQFGMCFEPLNGGDGIRVWCINWRSFCPPFFSYARQVNEREWYEYTGQYKIKNRSRYFCRSIQFSARQISQRASRQDRKNEEKPDHISNPRKRQPSKTQKPYQF